MRTAPPPNGYGRWSVDRRYFLFGHAYSEHADAIGFKFGTQATRLTTWFVYHVLRHV